MIITCGGIKGGSGKTTLAVNTTIYLSRLGRDVLLIDADDQQTATKFSAIRQQMYGQTGYTLVRLNGSAINSEVLKLSAKYDDIVIDAGGRDTSSQRSALTVSHVMVVPFVPRSFDVWTIEEVDELLDSIKAINPDIIPFSFISRGDTRIKRYNEEAIELLKTSRNIEYAECIIRDRIAYADASKLGLSVYELKVPDPKAEAELNELMKLLIPITAD